MKGSTDRAGESEVGCRCLSQTGIETIEGKATAAVHATEEGFTAQTTKHPS
jgi:hypothetical protein